jgi:hypothetical protein
MGHYYLSFVVFTPATLLVGGRFPLPPTGSLGTVVFGSDTFEVDPSPAAVTFGFWNTLFIWLLGTFAISHYLYFCRIRKHNTGLTWLIILIENDLLRSEFRHNKTTVVVLLSQRDPGIMRSLLARIFGYLSIQLDCDLPGVRDKGIFDLDSLNVDVAKTRWPNFNLE